MNVDINYLPVLSALKIFLILRIEESYFQGLPKCGWHLHLIKHFQLSFIKKYKNACGNLTVLTEEKCSKRLLLFGATVLMKISYLKAQYSNKQPKDCKNYYHLKNLD